MTSSSGVGVYADYSRARIGWFFGLSGWQLAAVSLTVLPVAWAVERGAWRQALLLTAAWVVVLMVTITPIRGRSVTGWLAATSAFTVGALFGWTRFRARLAAGRPGRIEQADLPGALQGLQIHDGPPHGPTLTRIAMIQDHTRRTWAVTAAVNHLGIGMAELDRRLQFGVGLSDLLDLASRTELVDEISFLVRTVPEDGAERDQWIARHRRPSAGPAAAAEVRRVTDDLHAGLTRASVRTEAFVTVVVSERRIAKEARASGGGLEGRARVLYGVIGEVEGQLRGGMGMTSVSWLTSPELAAACRTGFAPGDRAGIIDALAAAAQDPTVTAEVPWSLAGPSGADPAVRHYSHDAWNSVSAAVILPVKGAAMGALAPVLTPTEPGERRSFLVCYPVLSQQAADRHSASSEWAADLGDELRHRAKVKQRSRSRDETAKVRRLDTKLARGNALVRPYAVATVTVPKTAPAGEFGRRLDASIRRAGFAPLRLDLAQDTAFAASTVPLGVGLNRKGG